MKRNLLFHVQERRVFIIFYFSIKCVSSMKRCDVFNCVSVFSFSLCLSLQSQAPAGAAQTSVSVYWQWHVYMCCLFVYWRWPWLLISSTGALGNDHPRDPLQRTGRVTSGLARGGEERGSRVREHVYIRAAHTGKSSLPTSRKLPLHQHLCFVSLQMRTELLCSKMNKWTKIFVNSI